MKRETVVLMVALICGIAAFALIFNFLKQASQPKNEFVMAQKDIAKGAVLSAADLILSPPLKDISAHNYFTQIHEVIGMAVLEDVTKNKLISRAMVKEVKAAPKKVIAEDDVTLPVPPSMRALTLSYQELENVPQTLKPGDYVDVLGQVLAGNNEKEVRTFLRGVLILGVQRTEKRLVENVIVALHPPQVEALLNTSKSGRMRLVITQKPTDSAEWSNMGSIEVIRGIQRERKVA